MIDQGRDVLAPVAQGRGLDREDIQAIEQILAEGAVLDLLGWVAIGRRDDAHVDLDRAFAADGIDLALLQRAQQLDLHVQRQFADFVQEQGAAVRLAELAQRLVHGAGEGALLMPEQDGFDQIGGQGAAVDGDEGFAGPVAGAMQGAGDDLLADAALAGDQDGNGGFGGPGAQRLDHAHRRAVAHDIVEAGAALDALGQASDLGGQALHLHGVAHADQQAFRAHRFDEEVLGPGLHGLDHHVDAAVGRQDDDRLIDPGATQFGQAFQPRHLGHHHVQQDQVGPAAARHPVDGLAAAGGMDHGVAVPLQHGLDQPALGRIVVNDQDGLGHENPLYCRPTRQGWIVSGRFLGRRGENRVTRRGERPVNVAPSRRIAPRGWRAISGPRQLGRAGRPGPSRRPSTGLRSSAQHCVRR